MADISPFRGVRYNLEAAGDPSRLISPPYDVISPEQRVKLHLASEHNFVRLVLGEERPSDNAADSRFTRAAAFLQGWLTDGVMLRDPSPGLYRQRIEFSLHGQRRSLVGLTALVRLCDYDVGAILPHEKTLEGPKEDLARLMGATGANLDSVWLLYEDNRGEVGRAMAQASWREVVPAASGADAVTYSLDVTDEPSGVRSICDALRDEALTIADGHHRYETALAYARRMNGERPGADARPWEWAMATLVWTDDPGLTVLPTHRVLKDLPAEALEQVREKLAERISFQDVPRNELAAAISAAGDSSFAAYGATGSWLAAPKEPVDALGAEVLQQCVLAECLGFDITRLKSDPRIAYVEDASHALSMVDSGGYQAAFLLRPIPVRTITRYSRERRSMPQKSTYFYPKLASGLVLRLIEQDA